MGLATTFRKAATLARLSGRRQIRLGSSTYRLRSVIINNLALQDNAVTREPWLDAVLSSVLTCRHGALLDVGANIGQTMLKLLTLDPARQYVGFEPQVACCFLVQKFIEDNNLENHAILPVGLSNKNQLVKLQVRSGDYDSAASIIEGFRPDSFYRSYRYVYVRKGDEVMKELAISSVSALKIDVEGAELEVIEGLSGTIQEHVPFIIFEVLNSYLVITGETLDEQTTRFRQSRIERMERILTEHGYEIYTALPENILKKVREIRPAISADLSLTNYVAVPSRDRGPFLRAFAGCVQEC